MIKAILCNFCFRFNFIFLVIVIFISSCVDPPIYEDGLLTNIPAIVNETDYFSFSLDADDYTKNESWNLLFNGLNTDTLFTSFVLKNLAMSSNDTSYINLYNGNNAAILESKLLMNTTSIEKIPIEMIGNPARFEFIANQFFGLIEIQLIKQ